MKERKWPKWDQNKIFTLFLDIEPTLFQKTARLAILRPNVLNIELLEKCEIALQKQAIHSLSHKWKDPQTPLRDVICEWPLIFRENSLPTVLLPYSYYDLQ